MKNRPFFLPRHVSVFCRSLSGVGQGRPAPSSSKFLTVLLNDLFSLSTVLFERRADFELRATCLKRLAIKWDLHRREHHHRMDDNLRGLLCNI